MSWNRFIPFSPPLLGKTEYAGVISVMKSGWITTGPVTEEFEQTTGRYVQAKHAVACSSCTDALVIALTIIGVGPGDEVIVPTFTFTATAHAVLLRGAKLVFADIDKETMNISVDDVRRRLSRRTKAVIPVHYGGNPCNLKAIGQLATNENLSVIEDAAHAIGARYRGKMIGTISDMTCFSFYATKNLTTAEGGMITTNHKEFAERARRLTMYGISDARRIWSERHRPKGTWDYDVQELGYKANMPDILAAMGIHQLRRLQGFTRKRRKYASIYMRELQDVPDIAFQKTEEAAYHCRHLFPVLLPRAVDRDEIVTKLKLASIGTSVLWRPLHLHTFFRRYLKTKEGDYPNAENVFKRLINLPISPAHSAGNIRRVAKTLKQLLTR